MKETHPNVKMILTTVDSATRKLYPTLWTNDLLGLLRSWIRECCWVCARVNDRLPISSHTAVATGTPRTTVERTVARTSTDGLE